MCVFACAHHDDDDDDDYASPKKWANESESVSYFFVCQCCLPAADDVIAALDSELCQMHTDCLPACLSEATHPTDRVLVLSLPPRDGTRECSVRNKEKESHRKRKRPKSKQQSKQAASSRRAMGKTTGARPHEKQSPMFSDGFSKRRILYYYFVK